MRRLAAIMFCLALTAGAALAQSAGEPVAKLKAEVTVSGELVRIGDLLDNVGAAADIAVFRAPDIGETGNLPAYRVLDAVRPYGVVVDTAGNSAVAVTRTGRVLGAGDIEAAVARVIAARAGIADLRYLTITFDREPRPLRLDQTAGELRAAQVNYFASSGRFDVTFDLPGRSVSAGAARYSGTALETVQVPVMARALARGETVKAGDVLIERRPKAGLRDEFSAPAVEPVGLAARRALRPGQTLRMADLMKPEIVQRNEAVTLVYEVPGLTLTVRGTALEAGAEGDVINVMNIQSKRTVQGTVAGPARIIVRTFAPRLASGDASPSIHPGEAAGRRTE